MVVAKKSVVPSEILACFAGGLRRDELFGLYVEGRWRVDVRMDQLTEKCA